MFLDCTVQKNRVNILQLAVHSVQCYWICRLVPYGRTPPPFWTMSERKTFFGGMASLAMHSYVRFALPPEVGHCSGLFILLFWKDWCCLYSFLMLFIYLILFNKVAQYGYLDIFDRPGVAKAAQQKALLLIIDKPSVAGANVISWLPCGAGP